MNTHIVEATIAAVGLLPSVRAASVDDGWFAVKAVLQTGLRTVEIDVATPDALGLVERSVDEFPDRVIGVGTVLERGTAARAIAAGAQFISLPGLDDDVIADAATTGTMVIVGGLTPTEILMAWRAGAHAVKVFPAGALGGGAYIKALKASFPDVPLVAAGGVTQRSAAALILAGATALGVGRAVIPPRAIQHRQADWIAELIGRFEGIVQAARSGALV